MSDDDMGIALLESLQRANPVVADDVADRRDLPSAHALFAEITAERPRRVSTRALVVVLTLVALAAVTVLGAFGLVDRTDDLTPSQAPFCYEKADLHSQRLVASSADLTSGCAQLWRDGTFAGPVPTSFDRCLLSPGVVGVFPGESGSVCAGLGLHAVQTTSYGERVRAAANEVGLALERQCADPDRPAVVAYDDAAAVVRGILDGYGLSDWTIEPGDNALSAKQPCASPAFVDSTKTVLIQSINRG
jgi:hypothetical protein